MPTRGCALDIAYVLQLILPVFMACTCNTLLVRGGTYPPTALLQTWEVFQANNLFFEILSDTRCILCRYYCGKGIRNPIWRNIFSFAHASPFKWEARKALLAESSVVLQKLNNVRVSQGGQWNCGPKMTQVFDLFAGVVLLFWASS